MGDLADVLKLLHDAEPRWQTLRASGRLWCHTARSSAAFEAHFAALQARQSPGSAARFSRGYVPDVPPPDESEEHWRLWVERGGRKRAEFAVGQDQVTVVFDGDTWWSWSPSLGGITNTGRNNVGHGSGPAEVLIDTAPLLAALRLEALGHDTIAGRPVFIVGARNRRGDDVLMTQTLNGLGIGADDYALAVDAERGVLLRCEARLHGEPFRVIEATDVEFDADIPADVFTIELPPGEKFEEVSVPDASWKPRTRFSRRPRRRPT